MFAGWDEKTLLDAYYRAAMQMIEYLQDDKVTDAERYAMHVDEFKTEMNKRGILFYPIEVCMGVGADLCEQGFVTE